MPPKKHAPPKPYKSFKPRQSFKPNLRRLNVRLPTAKQKNAIVVAVVPPPPAPKPAAEQLPVVQVALDAAPGKVSKHSSYKARGPFVKKKRAASKKKAPDEVVVALKPAAPLAQQLPVIEVAVEKPAAPRVSTRSSFKERGSFAKRKRAAPKKKEVEAKPAAAQREAKERIQNILEQNKDALVNALAVVEDNGDSASMDEASSVSYGAPDAQDLGILTPSSTLVLGRGLVSSAPGSPIVYEGDWRSMGQDTTRVDLATRLLPSQQQKGKQRVAMPPPPDSLQATFNRIREGRASRALREDIEPIGNVYGNSEGTGFIGSNTMGIDD